MHYLLVCQKYYILSTRKHKHYQITSRKNAIDTKPEKCFSLRLKVWLPWYRNCCERSCHLNAICFTLKNMYESIYGEVEMLFFHCRYTLTTWYDLYCYS